MGILKYSLNQWTHSKVFLLKLHTLILEHLVTEHYKILFTKYNEEVAKMALTCKQTNK